MQFSPKRKLHLSLLIDLVGMLSFLIPIAAELTDMAWAPVSAWLVSSHFHMLIHAILMAASAYFFYLFVAQLPRFLIRLQASEWWSSGGWSSLAMRGTTRRMGEGSRSMWLISKYCTRFPLGTSSTLSTRPDEPTCQPLRCCRIWLTSLPSA